MSDAGRGSELSISRRERLLELTPQLRWEVTRRNPIYLVTWKVAKQFRESLETLPADEVPYAILAVELLKHIGVTASPGDPGLSFEQLDERGQLEADHGGAVQHMTNRHIIGTLLANLPKTELTYLKTLCAIAVDDEYAVVGDNERRSVQREKATLHLSSIDSPALDSYFVAPLYYINPRASLKEIRAAIDILMKQEKKRKKLPKRRISTRKLLESLKVFDMREGWRDGRYVWQEAMAIRDIAKVTKRRHSTLVNSYGEAFKWIVGVPFSKDVWTYLFLSTLASPDDVDVSPVHLRRLRSLVAKGENRQDDDANVAQMSENMRHPAGESAFTDDVWNDISFVDLCIDVRTLIDKGASDEEIRDELDLKDVQAVQYLRSRVLNDA